MCENVYVVAVSVVVSLLLCLLCWTLHFSFLLFVSDVCFRYEGSGLLDRLSFLPGQNPQSQQGRWGSISPFTPDLLSLNYLVHLLISPSTEKIVLAIIYYPKTFLSRVLPKPDLTREPWAIVLLHFITDQQFGRPFFTAAVAHIFDDMCTDDLSKEKRETACIHLVHFQSKIKRLARRRTLHSC